MFLPRDYFTSKQNWQTDNSCEEKNDGQYQHEHKPRFHSYRYKKRRQNVKNMLQIIEMFAPFQSIKDVTPIISNIGMLIIQRNQWKYLLW